MEGKSFYGKTTSPKVIAEASLAYSFSFDLQRFAGEEFAWSVGSGDDENKLIYASSSSSIASLSIDSDSNTWKLTTTVTSGNSNTVEIDLTSNADAQKNVVESLKSSAATNIKTFDASVLTNLPFKFKLNANTQLTSILGSNQGDSIDASAVANVNLSITGGSGNDTLIAGKSGTFYLDGGAGNDSLYGGNGKDYFIYSAGIDSIFQYGNNDFISLTGSAALPGVSKVNAEGDNLVLGFTDDSASLAVNGAKDSTVTVLHNSGGTTTTYFYNKDYIRTGNQFSLTAAASSFDASSFTSAVTIDGSAADATNGLEIIGTSRDDSIIGSANKASTIFGGGGNDFVSLKGEANNVDIFVYNGSGKASIEGLGTSGYVSLSATKAALITDGNYLELLAGSGAEKSSFRLTFGTNNTLTFINSDSASIKAGTNTLVYTPTAISIKGAGSNGDSITLGSSYDGTGKFEGPSYSVISAAAVSVSNGSFAVSGNTDGANLIWGSDKQVTSILGSSGADALYAGKTGASLVGNGGQDSLFGDTAKAAKDYFFYSDGKALITNYTNSGDNEDVVSLTGSYAAPTALERFSLDSGTNTFNISLGTSDDANVLSFASSRQVNIHAVGVSVGESNINTLFHYEADKVIVDNNRVTLGSNFKGSNYKVSSLGETYENMASIDASEVTTSGGLNITGHESNDNSIIGAQSGGKITGGTGSDYLKSGVEADNSTVTTTIDAGIDPADSNTTDTLVGGTGYDWFIYRGAQASIGSYTSGKDTIQILGEGLNMMSEDEPPVFATVEAAAGGGDGGGGGAGGGGAGGESGESQGQGGGSQVPEETQDPEPDNQQSEASAGDLVLALGTNSLTVAGGAALDFTTTFRYGQNTFNYKSGAVSLNNKSVTLTSDYQVGDSAYTATGSISAVNASAVTISGTGNFVSLKANDNFDTRLTGSTNYANSLVSGAKNDSLLGGDKADIFVYTGGKDTVANYQYEANVSSSTITDSLLATDFVDKIASGKVSGSKLIFTGTDNKNVLTFLSDDDAIEKVSLSGGGYLTKDGKVSNGRLKLFSSAKGEIDLTDTNLYKLGENGSTSNITSVNAADVKQSIILTTDSLSSDATYILPGNNKKRDRFMYAGGKVSISGYEGGKDQINLGDGSIKGFAISDDGVLQISVSSDDNDIISIAGGNGADLLIHQSTDANNIYRKMALTQAGILTNRVSKPTTATVLGGAASLKANENALGGGTIKKIFAANDAVTNVSIEAGNKNNTTINMSAAGSGVSIYGGKKNDKITGSNTEGDLFVYKTDSNVGGKDVITNYTSGSDVVSIGAGALASLSGAKITARDKSVMIKFSGNKNSLNLKNSDSNITAVTIRDNGTDTSFTFGKSSFSTDSGRAVSLTSAFSGSFDLSKVKLGDNSASSVDGHLVGKNLTYKGTAASETLSGGSRKTTFKGGGGTDELTGGSGKDIFTYAKGNAGTTTIKDFDYTKDQIKIAGGTLDKIETISGGVRFAMKNNGSNIGWYNITSAAAYKKDGTKDTENILEAPSSTNTVFKANNTYFWFAPDTVTDEVTVKGSEEKKETVTLASAGDLITYNTRVSASDVSDLHVIDLNYSTNLVKSGVAVAVSKTASGANMPGK